MPEKVTPIRQQYLDIKAQYPNHLLLFRLGDFYECFDDDALTLASALDLILTGRSISRTQRVPMAGFPYHALAKYVAQLVAQGYDVAICEQVAQGLSTGGLVERRVTRLVTAKGEEDVL